MKIGRPLKFETVEDLQAKIDEYFEITPKDEWTITGLAIALDTYRKVLCEYGDGKYDEEDRDFSNTVKKAKQIVENGYEIDLKKHGRPGTIFALKNFDWKDKNETDLHADGDFKINLISYADPNSIQVPTETLSTTDDESAGQREEESGSDLA